MVNDEYPISEFACFFGSTAGRSLIADAHDRTSGNVNSFIFHLLEALLCNDRMVYEQNPMNGFVFSMGVVHSTICYSAPILVV